MDTPGLTTDAAGRSHCTWRTSAPEYPHYHDHEWGVPVADDIQLYEKICLEGFQAGMAWITILRKRERFRRAFDGFDFRQVAQYGEADIERLMQDPGIVRNRAKIVSAINNARRACELVAETGSLARWLWAFEPAEDERPAVVDLAYWTVNPTSPASVRLSKALKRRGWTYVGPTTMYALMQAMGMVNDHLEGCFCREGIEDLRRQFKRP
ncbi:MULTISPECIES: DNA-3-methyladenine glycosylase I [Pseudomonas]|jgi:DNA-3-methyladenine glycosylase I|uniref:DNA-3-methyladenine glycosylase I n=1 Tax=Pseudomonas fluorescens TaxID=294 RepID=A0A4Y9TDZ0_PSEFL|nr:MULTISPECIES: DNA-3-methyladenine glycosylase I [Pseudomonas]CRM91325.1 DNA-3-methyladenine glycosylase 1 [Pseudomonas sp. 22 E 5]TFW42633.1 DNA-3-methyladenine glycosylase I [Pseudomonas fluorescens]TKJ59355.1 DNA-3-methyladenine glycosylase I [Pseudomonas sp. CFBP13506]CRM43197.1 DNA-3-methyladenine glycosylase 1 [Pseudomonas sp. 31 E 5]CRM61816.1 DNA-3-methyladenine glycosylase 1 [Pseudomonas sp. 31 E 6]